jgi:hypothetical protein
MQILKRLQRPAINVFLVFHMVAIACWCIPVRTPLVQLCKSAVTPYFRWSGLFQSWDTFAPAPWAMNSYVEATIIYKDGSRKTWVFPRMEQLGLTERYVKERYRKFEEGVQRDENDALWPDIARHIARMNNSPEHPVKTIILIQRWSLIVLRPGGVYTPEPWQQHILFGYGVRPEDLQ